MGFDDHRCPNNLKSGEPRQANSGIEGIKTSFLYFTKSWWHVVDNSVLVTLQWIAWLAAHRRWRTGSVWSIFGFRVKESFPLLFQRDARVSEPQSLLILKTHTQMGCVRMVCFFYMGAQRAVCTVHVTLLLFQWQERTFLRLVSDLHFQMRIIRKNISHEPTIGCLYNGPQYPEYKLA